MDHSQKAEPIYQARRHEDEEKTWTDCYEATHFSASQCPQFYETRIVYAAPQPSAAVVLDDEPVAWLHTMHMELDQTTERLSFSPGNPWGEPGLNYSEEYEVTSEPLFLARQG